MPFSLFLALKYMQPKRSFISAVTLLSVLGVVIGVSTLVVVQSIMSGFDLMWREKILSFKPHLIVRGTYGPIRDERSISDKIAALPGVTGASACIETRVMIQHRGYMSAPLILGLDPERAASVTRVSEEEFLLDGRFELDDEGVVLGKDLARELGCVVGDKLLLHSPRSVTSLNEVFLPSEVVVRGIFSLGMRDFDAGFVLASIDVVGDLLGMDEGASSIYVMTENPLLFESYTASLKELLGPAYDVASWKDIDRMLFNALAHEKAMMFIVLLFITIVAIFCVTNTLIVISVNKTHEIGLLKALGFATRRIMAVFMWHGWIQCFVGTVLGIGTGLLILVNLDNIVSGLGKLGVDIFPKDIYGLEGIPWHTTWQELAFVATLVMVICTFSSLLPVWLAARRDPVDALRQE